jgi:hypothetical protein
MGLVQRTRLKKVAHAWVAGGRNKGDRRDRHLNLVWSEFEKNSRWWLREASKLNHMGGQNPSVLLIPFRPRQPKSKRLVKPRSSVPKKCPCWWDVLSSEK